MENKSIWNLYMRKNYYDKLDKDIECDVLIIGGGITGITTGYFLKDSKMNVVLIEKDHVGCGATGHTTGKLTIMQDIIYSKMDYDTSKLYLESQRDAINIVKDIVSNYNIECNLQKNNSYLFTDDINKILNFKKEEKRYDELFIHYKSNNKIPINYPCNYSIKTNDSYVFHPIKYLYSLKKIISKDIKIYENTKAINLSKKDNFYYVNTDDNVIKAKYVVIATQYPFFISPYFLPFKSNIKKSYIVSGIVNKDKLFNAISNKNSIRYYSNKNKNYIIYSSTNNNIDDVNDYKNLINNFKFNFNTDIKYYYQNQDIITLDNLPLIGRINNSNLLIGTGYNTWGMTNGTIAGKVLSDIILNKDNKYIDLFKLNRGFNLNKISNLLIYNFSTIKRFVISKVNYKYPKNVKIINKDGIKYGIYIDKSNKEHIVKNICPHMKCNLIFNSIDKTWDCPCHGSKFDYDGNILFGPSVRDIKVDDDLK